MKVSGCFVLACLLLPTSAALAQPRTNQGGVAQSGMGQGEAAITTRSDVTMGIENGPGTSGARLRALAEALTTKMGDVRQCYAEITAERPTVQGAMRVRVEVPNGRGAARVEVSEDTTSDAPLSRCVLRALRAASVEGVERPANAFVALQFGNTAARGVEEVHRRRAEEDNVSVTNNSDGRPEASGGPASGELRFTVTADGSSTATTVQAIHRALRTAIPSLLDCRRRAGRRDSPEGRITIDARLARAGTVTLRTVSSTVANDRAPQCVSRAITTQRFGHDAAGRVTVAIDFSPAAAVTQAIPEPTPTPRNRRNGQ